MVHRVLLHELPAGKRATAFGHAAKALSVQESFLGPRMGLAMHSEGLRVVSVEGIVEGDYVSLGVKVLRSVLCNEYTDGDLEKSKRYDIDGVVGPESDLDACEREIAKDNTFHASLATSLVSLFRDSISLDITTNSIATAPNVDIHFVGGGAITEQELEQMKKDPFYHRVRCIVWDVPRVIDGLLCHTKLPTRSNKLKEVFSAATSGGSGIAQGGEGKEVEQMSEEQHWDRKGLEPLVFIVGEIV